MRRGAGFTLIELLIVISVIGILAAMGLPSLGDVLRDNVIRAHAEQTVDGLQRARLEAIQRNASVSFVPLEDNVGWKITMTDPKGGADLVLHEHKGLESEAAYTANYSSALEPARIDFRGNGRASDSSFSVDFGHATASCAADGGTVRCLRLQVSARGVARMCDPALSAPDPRICR